MSLERGSKWPTSVSIANCCGCQVLDASGDGVGERTRVEDDATDSGDGVVERTRAEDDAIESVGVDGVWRIAGPVLAKTWGQLPTRPDGLFRTVGRTSLNEAYVLVRFKLLDEWNDKD